MQWRQVLTCWMKKLSWWRLLTAQNSYKSRLVCQSSKGKQIPSVQARKASPNSLRDLLAEGGEREKGKPHTPGDSVNTCRLPDSPTRPDRMRTPLISLTEGARGGSHTRALKKKLCEEGYIMDCSKTIHRNPQRRSWG
ncbi:uncharacterized protein LOC143646241 [Tamandua tetradactyla]|uniref:uncharacterized protein LOC143646241 n=1 Tax=Tamandua tetradactyla TaxID=48850 RepID=UPI00405422FC